MILQMPPHTPACLVLKRLYTKNQVYVINNREKGQVRRKSKYRSYDKSFILEIVKSIERGFPKPYYSGTWDSSQCASRLDAGLWFTGISCQ